MGRRPAIGGAVVFLGNLGSCHRRGCNFDALQSTNTVQGDLNLAFFQQDHLHCNIYCSNNSNIGGLFWKQNGAVEYRAGGHLVTSDHEFSWHECRLCSRWRRQAKATSSKTCRQRSEKNGALSVPPPPLGSHELICMRACTPA